MAELFKIFPGGIPLRHIEFRQLGNAEFDFHLAAIRYFLGILQRFQGIGKQLSHLLFRFYKILPPLIAHPVLIRKLFAGLQAQKDIVGIHICFVGIMDIIGSH